MYIHLERIFHKLSTEGVKWELKEQKCSFCSSFAILKKMLKENLISCFSARSFVLSRRCFVSRSNFFWRRGAACWRFAVAKHGHPASRPRKQDWIDLHYPKYSERANRVKRERKCKWKFLMTGAILMCSQLPAYKESIKKQFDWILATCYARLSSVRIETSPGNHSSRTPLQKRSKQGFYIALSNYHTSRSRHDGVAKSAACNSNVGHHWKFFLATSSSKILRHS